MKIKALSVRQPWAHLIAEGVKTVEVRSRPTKYRGPLLICASRTFKPVWWMPRLPFPPQAAKWRREDMGFALCLVELVNCTAMAPEHEKAALVECRPGLYAWTLRRPEKVERFPVLGRLGLFDVDLPSPAGLVVPA